MCPDIATFFEHFNAEQSSSAEREKEITVSNQTADEVKVKKFDYRDFDKADWKTENGTPISGTKVD
jgi:hypothetical protein